MKRTLAWAALAALSLASMWWMAEIRPSDERPHGPRERLEGRPGGDTLVDPPEHHIATRWCTMDPSDLSPPTRRTS